MRITNRLPKVRKGSPYVWMMVRQAMSSLGGKATRREVLKWVRQKYPEAKANTVGCQITICTVNNPTRVQFTQNSKPRHTREQYDFLFAEQNGTLVWYSPAKHGHWTIQQANNGKLSIHCLPDVVGPKAPAPSTHILFCGTPNENDDYAVLSNISLNGGRNLWSSVSKARAGDRVLFYTVHERCAFMASGWILRDANSTRNKDDFPYRAWVGAIRLFDRPVSIQYVKNRFPSWKWARYRRNITTVPKGMGEQVWNFVHKKAQASAPVAPSGAEMPKPSGSQGAGFGDPRANRIVEQAAIKAAKRLLRKRNYKVKSREKENTGYDLDAWRGEEIMHVEVKGVAGIGMNFIITQNEVATARIDSSFRLMVVNEACSRSPKITEFSGRDFDAKFSITAISYYARMKKN